MGMSKAQMKAALGGGWDGNSAGGGPRQYLLAGKGEIRWTHAEIRNGFKGLSFIAVGEILRYEPGRRLAEVAPFDPVGTYPADALKPGDEVSFVVKLGGIASDSRIAGWALAVAQSRDPGVDPGHVNSDYVADLLDSGSVAGTVTSFNCWEQVNKDGTGKYTRESFSPVASPAPAPAPAPSPRDLAKAKFPSLSAAIDQMSDEQIKALL